MAIIDVDVWIWPLQSGPEECGRLESRLSGDERQRADRFLAASHRADYIVGRGRLREILSTYTHRPPQSLHFTYGSGGKPGLAGHADDPCFNLSHSSGLAALAVTPAHPIGVDVEAERPIKENIAERFFSAAEQRSIAALPAAEQTAAFFRCWTRKEAFVKAVGDGLNFPLATFDVAIGPDAAVKRIAGVDEAELAQWRMFGFQPRQGMAGAIALSGVPCGDTIRARYFRLSPAGWSSET